MGIKEFLIQNYIWIIVIIVITIITIIGFLADKKKGGKKKETPVTVTPNLNNQPINNQGQVQYQAPIQTESNQINNNLNNNAINNNWGVNNNMNTTINPINQMNSNNISNIVQPIGSIPQPVVQSMSNTIEPTNTPQPVENIMGNVEQEIMYQPLTEQKQTIPSQPMPHMGFVPNQVGQELNQINSIPTNVIPTPIENTPNFVGVTPQGIQPQPGMQAPLMQEQTQPELPLYNNVQSPIQIIENNNQGVIPNFIQNNTTIPQPLNPMPTPQPVMSEPIMSSPMMQEGYNQPQMMQPNLGQSMQQQTPNIPIGQPVGSTSTAQTQPVNFVYGPQNNQNM